MGWMDCLQAAETRAKCGECAARRATIHTTSIRTLVSMSSDYACTRRDVSRSVEVDANPQTDVQADRERTSLLPPDTSFQQQSWWILAK